MMYYFCNQGKNYYEFKDVKFCVSCGEIILFCFYKVIDYKVVLLFYNCIYIKIIRLIVYILCEEKFFVFVIEIFESV